MHRGICSYLLHLVYQNADHVVLHQMDVIMWMDDPHQSGPYFQQRCPNGRVKGDITHAERTVFRTFANGHELMGYASIKYG